MWDAAPPCPTDLGIHPPPPPSFLNWGLDQYPSKIWIRLNLCESYQNCYIQKKKKANYKVLKSILLFLLYFFKHLLISKLLCVLILIFESNLCVSKLRLGVNKIMILSIFSIINGEKKGGGDISFLSFFLIYPTFIYLTSRTQIKTIPPFFST